MARLPPPRVPVCFLPRLLRQPPPVAHARKGKSLVSQCYHTSCLGNGSLDAISSFSPSDRSLGRSVSPKIVSRVLHLSLLLLPIKDPRSLRYPSPSSPSLSFPVNKQPILDNSRGRPKDTLAFHPVRRLDNTPTSEHTLPTANMKFTPVLALALAGVATVRPS